LLLACGSPTTSRWRCTSGERLGDFSSMMVIWCVNWVVPQKKVYMTGVCTRVKLTH
jgi:hypothetical protein